MFCDKYVRMWLNDIPLDLVGRFLTQIAKGLRSSEYTDNVAVAEAAAPAVTTAVDGLEDGAVFVGDRDRSLDLLEGELTDVDLAGDGTGGDWATGDRDREL